MIIGSRCGEEEEYAQSLIRLMDELTPDGELEAAFNTEIMGATRRLRRCRLVEEAFGMVDDLDFDPLMDEPYSIEDETNDLSVRHCAEGQRRWSKAAEIGRPGPRTIAPDPPP